MVFNRTSCRERRARGFTILESLFATSVGVMVLAASLLLWGYASRTCAMLYGYVEMSSTSKNALDRISQQIRNARQVLSCSAQQLILIVPSETTTNFAQLMLRYSAINRVLLATTTETGQPTVTKILLTQCTNFQFSVYQRTPISNSFALYTNGWSSSTAKIVQMQWQCSRALRGDQNLIENQVSANVVIRSK